MAGFTHARGPGKQAEGIASSAFSEGDVLIYDSSSSLSRADVSAISGTNEIAGIARADSTDSVNDLVTYTRPTDEDVFFSEMTAPFVGSDVTKGVKLDLDTDGNGRSYVSRSGNTDHVVVVEGTGDVLGQSNQSRVMVRFLDDVLPHDA